MKASTALAIAVLHATAADGVRAAGADLVPLPAKVAWSAGEAFDLSSSTPIVVAADDGEAGTAASVLVNRLHRTLGLTLPIRRGPARDGAIVLERRASTPADLEGANANLIGGDVSGGAMTARQMLFRPTLRGYATSDPKIYLCSASTPPGGGVHGMCGYHAATTALKNLGR